MESKSRIMFLLGRLVPSILAFITTAALTRILDPTKYGTYALGISIIYFVATGFDWLGISLLRMTPAAKAPKLFFGTVLVCFYGMCLFSTIVAAGILILFDMQRFALLTAACLLAAFAASWFELGQSIQTAKLRHYDYFYAGVFRGVSSVTLACALAYFTGYVTLILLSFTVSFFLSSFIKRDSRLNLFNFKFDYPIYIELVKFGLPLCLSLGIVAVLNSIDKWLLQAFLGSKEVGFFAAASIIAQAPLMSLSSGLGSSSYSMAVRELEFGGEIKAKAKLIENFTLLLGIILPAAIGIIATSSNLAYLVGHTYWEAVVELAPWLCGASVFWALRVGYTDMAFQLANKTRRLIWITLFILIVNISLNVYLIPQFGVLGAAIGSFTALFTGFIVSLVAGIGVFRMPMPVANSLKIIISAGLMFLAIRSLAGFHGILPLIGQIALGSITYLSGLLIFNVLGMFTKAKLIVQGLIAGRSKVVISGRGGKVDATDSTRVAVIEKLQ
jgi:O-antigen/teichoic acid export membrane protein